MIVRAPHHRRNRDLGFWWMALVPLVTEALKPKEGPIVPPAPAVPQVDALTWAALGLGAVVLIGGVALVLKSGSR